jgi:hypothetical protein
MASDPIPERVVPPTSLDPRTRWEIPLAGCLAALCLAAFLAVPFFGAIGLPLAAVPLVRVTHRMGVMSGLLSTGLAVAILVGVTLASAGARDATGIGLATAVVAALPVLMTGRVRRGVDPSRAFLVLALSGSLLLAAALLALPAAGQAPVGSELRAAFDAMTPAAIESYKRSRADAATIDRVRATLESARDLAATYWAGLAGACWIFASAAAFYAGARSARPAPSAEAVRFETLRLPAGLAFCFVASGAVFALAPAPARTVGGDVLIALAALYFVAGLSIICHFARKWFRFWLPRAGLYFLALYFPMSLGVALLGLFDWYVNFRRRGEKE